MLASSRPYASAAVAGLVKTVPGLLESPTGVTYDPDDGNAYVLDGRQSSNVTVITQISRTGASRAFASLPVGGAVRITYDRALKTFFATATQGPNNSGASIYAITADARVRFLAGGGAFGQNDGTSSTASFSSQIGGITVDTKNGKLYVADGDRIRAVTTSGVVTTLTKPNVIGGSFGATAGIAYNAFEDTLDVADTASIRQQPMAL